MAEGSVPIFNLQNFGERNNCSLTALYPAVVTVHSLNVEGNEGVNFNVSCTRYFALKPNANRKPTFLFKCENHSDKLTIGGSNGLESYNMEQSESICGRANNIGRFK